MDVLTPKKLVESSSRCFIRLSATIAKDKIYIFGKKFFDIAERIVNDFKSLNEDVISRWHKKNFFLRLRMIIKKTAIQYVFEFFPS